MTPKAGLGGGHHASSQHHGDNDIDGSGWCTNFVWLKNGCLTFYDTDKDGKPAALVGFFYLEGSCVRPLQPSSTKTHTQHHSGGSGHGHGKNHGGQDASTVPAHCLQLVGSCGALLLQAKDQGEQLQWVSTLYYAIALCNSADFVQACLQEASRSSVASREEAMAREQKERAIRCMMGGDSNTGAMAAVVMEGLLTKKSIGKTLVPNWKKRYFRLYYYGKLAYYVGDPSSNDGQAKSTEAKGSIQLTWDMQVHVSTSRTNSFQIKSPASNEITLQAPDPATMATWMQAIQKIIDSSVQGSDQSQTRFVV
jgi:hypothetical protein